jgi:aspartyl-tRNA synthetase
VVNRVSCGDLRECHVGMEVELWGRVQYQRVGRFLTLRDQYGMTQVVAPDDVSSLLSRGILISSNYCKIFPVSYFYNI